MAVIWIDRAFGDLDALGHELIGPVEDDRHRADAVVLELAGGTAPGERWAGWMFDQVPGLRAVALTGGDPVDDRRIDLSEATRRGIAVIGTADVAEVARAEHAVALLLAAAKTLPRHQHRFRTNVGGFGRLSTGEEFAGSTLGLVGYDGVARRVAAVAAALGMRVIVHDPFVFDPTTSEGHEVVEFDQLLAEADHVSLHVPAAPDTACLFDGDVLGRCRHGLTLINISAPVLVDHDALRAALHEGQVGNAGLDLDPAVLGADHPLANRDDVVLTPGVAGATRTTMRRSLQVAVDRVAAALDGERPPGLLNGDALAGGWDDLEAE
ncbi:MAG: NAD(P)-dependent oxidoreductase [Acidimicrobiales bacterium]